MALAPPDPMLESLLARIRSARVAVARGRGQVTQGQAATARHELMVALDAYAAALERRRLPIPWRMQTELRLHRELFDD